MFDAMAASAAAALRPSSRAGDRDCAARARRQRVNRERRFDGLLWRRGGLDAWPGVADRASIKLWQMQLNVDKERRGHGGRGAAGRRSNVEARRERNWHEVGPVARAQRGWDRCSMKSADSVRGTRSV